MLKPNSIKHVLLSLQIASYALPQWERRKERRKFMRQSIHGLFVSQPCHFWALKTSKKFTIASVAGSGSLGSQPEKLGRRDERLKSKAPGDEVASRGIPQISCGTQSDAFDFATGMLSLIHI